MEHAGINSWEEGPRLYELIPEWSRGACGVQLIGEGAAAVGPRKLARKTWKTIDKTRKHMNNMRCQSEIGKS